MDKDITDKIEFLNNDDEVLSITKCVCGHEYEPWCFYIDIYRDIATTCDHCGRKMYFKNTITVYEVVEKEDK